MFHRLHSLRRSWFPLLLAVLLVVLQAGTVLHVLGHVSDAQRPDSPAPPQHLVCALCAAYAGTDGALTLATPALPGVGTARASVAHQPFAALPSFILPYQVRAPPVTAGV